MRVPIDVVKAISNGLDLGFHCTDDGTVLDGFYRGSGAYPPPGYLPWNAFQIGNGDTYGFYWPIGLEHENPLVCTIAHDSWEFWPVASSLRAFITLELASRDQDSNWEFLEAAEICGIDADTVTQSSDDESASEVRTNTMSAEDQLLIDPESPQILKNAAREALSRSMPDLAVTYLERSVTRLPEYSEAWALLAQAYRQLRVGSQAAVAMARALTAPFCFGARDRRKLIYWLQCVKETPEISQDPLWPRRHDLKWEAGVKEKRDYQIFEELIAEYHLRGMGQRAVALRVLAAEAMGKETISFRERAGWTASKFREQLRDDFERADLRVRMNVL
ncbi:hypothetical protein Pan44_23870 [Caulifigura coniformis]|uniref:Tetratricopeptide repeat protein n=1 Tax=Caulifigura coniformis TaxID=2527983 RepID=A0A517SE07_9PLAN|nr:hypothetical protein [Caulifigura coniformis]QDT54354.1 hypothetical protein Pan44_23870 [Caulifigura coniformis]